MSNSFIGRRKFFVQVVSLPSGDAAILRFLAAAEIIEIPVVRLVSAPCSCTCSYNGPLSARDGLRDCHEYGAIRLIRSKYL